jgi:hypothetical protein
MAAFPQITLEPPMEMLSRSQPPRPRHAPRTVSFSANSYDRLRELPSLVPLWPAELTDLSRAGRLRVLQHLRRALRSERRRGICGHWSYDLARHQQLLRAYRAEAHGLLSLVHTQAHVDPAPLKRGLDDVSGPLVK